MVGAGKIKQYSNILEKPLSKSKQEVSLSAFAFLFSELVQYNQTQVDNISELERRLEDAGYAVGARVLELLCHRDKGNRRETRLLGILSFVHSSVWKVLFGKAADSLEKGTEHEDEYMISEKDLLALFVGWKGVLDGAGFPAVVTAHFVPMEGLQRPRTTILIKFAEELVMQASALLRSISAVIYFSSYHHHRMQKAMLVGTCDEGLENPRPKCNTQLLVSISICFAKRSEVRLIVIPGVTQVSSQLQLLPYSSVMLFNFSTLRTSDPIFSSKKMSGEEVAVAQPEAPAALGEPMDINTALPLVVRKSQAHGGLARGLHEAAKAIEKHNAHLCILADDCDQPDYVKLVKALCADHNVKVLQAPSSKTLGEWAGLCKIDSEGKARKVVGCSCVVVKDYGEQHEAVEVVQQHKD
ncbi:hypothetical protein V6N11_066263 [Hibiscus sabdariffa]|uniref:40S ribosomal protein S12 n=1 Tax=Hibiscus sabdariffa TaxID=183260 RepID=A0ABR1ZPJ0_9ROSI